MLKRQSILLDLRQGEDLVRTFRLGTTLENGAVTPIDLGGFTLSLRIAGAAGTIEESAQATDNASGEVTITIAAARFAGETPGALKLQLWGTWSDGRQDHLGDGVVNFREGLSGA